VVASDAVTANALATLLCVTGAAYGFPIVEATPGAEALRVERGTVELTSGFVLQERPAPAQSPAAAWPAPPVHTALQSKPTRSMEPMPRNPEPSLSATVRQALRCPRPPTSTRC
jgi:hypothetical protein